MGLTNDRLGGLVASSTETTGLLPVVVGFPEIAVREYDGQVALALSRDGVRSLIRTLERLLEPERLIGESLNLGPLDGVTGDATLHLSLVPSTAEGGYLDAQLGSIQGMKGVLGRGALVDGRRYFVRQVVFNGTQADQDVVSDLAAALESFVSDVKASPAGTTGRLVILWSGDDRSLLEPLLATAVAEGDRRHG